MITILFIATLCVDEFLLKKKKVGVKKMLELSHIYKTFNQGTIDEKVLFSDFNITVNDGDFVGVIGSNGSGKTTDYVKRHFGRYAD